MSFRIFLTETSALRMQYFWAANVFKIRWSTNGFTGVKAETFSLHTPGTAEIGWMDSAPLVFQARTKQLLAGVCYQGEGGGSTEEKERQLLVSWASQRGQSWSSSSLLDDQSRGLGDIYSKSQHFLIKTTIENIHYSVVGGQETSCPFFAHLREVEKATYLFHLLSCRPPLKHPCQFASVNFQK